MVFFSERKDSTFLRNRKNFAEKTSVNYAISMNYMIGTKRKPCAFYGIIPVFG